MNREQELFFFFCKVVRAMVNGSSKASASVQF